MTWKCTDLTTTHHYHPQRQLFQRLASATKSDLQKQMLIPQLWCNMEFRIRNLFNSLIRQILPLPYDAGNGGTVRLIIIQRCLRKCTDFCNFVLVDPGISNGHFTKSSTKPWPEADAYTSAPDATYKFRSGTCLIRGQFRQVFPLPMMLWRMVVDYNTNDACVEAVWLLQYVITVNPPVSPAFFQVFP
jgi:hypothetical protein